VSDTQHDLASVHTSSFTELLHKAGVSVAITTYQAGKLILARAVGDVTNTHFRSFDKPMGMATDGRRLALGTDSHLWCFHNIPAAAAKQAGEQPLDALYLPRHIHVTGDVDIHEMALTGDDIWFINTRFSCLCTVSTEHSFQPRWKPDFISAYDMRDRCHLNGLAVRDGRPRYVTALGRSDEPGGWRRHKADGGLLIDMDSDRVLIDDLSMPHSPRWYRGSLWVLESGCGALCRVDAQSGARETVCELPGFTRGLDFIGDYALVGLSQVRETATFSGLPLTRKQPKRHSGVWVVDLRNGDIVAFIDDLLQPGNPYYYLRMFLRPAHRGVPGLRQFLSRATRRHLRDTPALAARARGVVIVTENHKFHEPGARRSLERNGWTYLGRNAQGHDVWFDNFDGSTHPLPAAAATNPTPPLY
jgi:uncharacterized protein (TIGR03032 family)